MWEKAKLRLNHSFSSPSMSETQHMQIVGACPTWLQDRCCALPKTREPAFPIYTSNTCGLGPPIIPIVDGLSIATDRENKLMVDYVSTRTNLTAPCNFVRDWKRPSFFARWSFGAPRRLSQRGLQQTASVVAFEKFC